MAVDRLRAMEDGERPPTRAMLSRMARQYHRPLVAFYLSQPPPPANWGRDFRAPSTDRSARDEAVLNALVRNVQARQGLLRSAMLDDDDDLAPLRFLGSATIDTPVTRVVADIRDTLGLQPAKFRATSNPDEAFRLLRAHAERAGIFVLLLGNLGKPSHRPGCGGFSGIRTTGRFRAVRRGQPQGLGGRTILHVTTRARPTVAPRARGERGRSNRSGRGVLQPGGLELPAAGHQARGAPHGGQKHETISATDGLWRTTDCVITDGVAVSPNSRPAGTPRRYPGPSER